MTKEEVLSGLKSQFSNDIIEFVDKSRARVYVEIKPEAIARLAQFIFKDHGARFNIATGVDTRSHIEILYHFTLEEIDCCISLRVKLDRDKPEIDSIANLFHGVNWIEREMHELLGINFKGHPNLKRLLLSDKWPEGVYPLRQDYKEWDSQAIRDRGV
jgi:Ni,Fe-hydrogenase III component G